MRLLVTGVAGFIGSNFVYEALVGSNREKFSSVTGIDSLTYAGSSLNLAELKKLKKFEFIQGNICSTKLMAQAIKKNDVVLNFAAETHVDNSLINSKKFVLSNYIGVSNILNILRNYPDKKFVQISTDEVYGQLNKGSWIESDKLDPRSPYSATKAAADLLILSYINSYGINSCITRSSNNFGPRQHPEKLIPKTIISALKKSSIPVYGTGNNIRDWIYVGHNILAIQKIIFEGTSGNIYNIGGGNELTNLDVVKKILDLLGVGHECIKFVPDRLGHDFRYSVSSNKLETELNFKVPKDFDTRLAETVLWYKTNSKWWNNSKLSKI